MVARELLGKILVRRTGDDVAAVRLTEVEAYLGVDDPACHTYGGRRTPRTETMWGAAGFAYVYLIYGVHHCLNVVTVGEGSPEAVLIRGASAVAGGAIIRRRRGAGVARRRLLDGPGKLCQALALTRGEDGLDFCDPGGCLTIRSDGREIPDEQVARLPRIGVEYAGEAAAWPLRLTVSSRPR